MDVFEVLGDPVRRRILELLVDGERSAGAVGAIIQQEFGVSQPGVSQHLRVLRDNGFTTVRAVGSRRLYAIDPTPLAAAERWLSRYHRFWTQRLDTLGDQIAREREDSISATATDTDTGTDADPATGTRTATEET